MRKKFCLLIFICVCFIFAGCSEYPAVGLINNSDGTVVEYYYIPFPEAQMQEILFPTERNKIITAKYNIKEECDKIFQNYINLYQSGIETTTEYSLEEKAELVAGVTFESNLEGTNELINLQVEYIQYTLNFTNSTCYNAFKNINNEIKEERQVVTKKTFFTTTTKVIKDPIFDRIARESITLGQNCLNVADNLMEKNLGTLNWQSIKNNLPGYQEGISHFNYIYVVPTARVHTNAHEVLQQNNYYFHIWKIDVDNLDENNDSIIKIEYWTTTANRVVWYLIAIGISIATIITIYIVGKVKEKNKKQTEE